LSGLQNKSEPVAVKVTIPRSEGFCYKEAYMPFPGHQTLLRTILKCLLPAVLLISVSACGLKNKFTYFYNDKSDSRSPEIFQEAVIRPGDRLEVKIAGLEPESSLPFYFFSGTGGQSTSNQASPANVFPVSTEGEIDMPVLGRISVGGLKLKEAESVIKSKLENLIRVPVVQVRIFNYMVTVLGEVKLPGYLLIPNNRINILELLAMAGDITANGNRKEVIVIRKSGDTEQQITIDLTSNSLFSSPGFHIRQNDVVYVRPNASGMLQPTLFRSTGPFALSVVSIFFTALLFFAR
jgi:polysaccharide export outer membrane protein